MAKIPFGILGPFIGKVGPVIGYIRGDTWCVRSMPMHYRDARTVAQLRNRNKMTRLMRFLCSMKPVIRASFDVWNSDNPCRTEFNMAFAENFHTALRTTAQNTEILYHKMRIADGLLPAMSGAEAYRDGNEIHVSWNIAPFATTPSKAEALPGDKLCICAHNAETGESAWDLNVASRQDGRAVFAIPEGWADGCVHIWGWFSSPFTTSPSIYLGKFAKAKQKQVLIQPASRRPLLRGVAQSAGACIRKHIPNSALPSTISPHQSATKAVPRPCPNRGTQGHNLGICPPKPPPKTVFSPPEMALPMAG